MAPPRKRAGDAGPRTLERIGACEIARCKKGCTAFLFVKNEGAFRICECGHTQQSHALVEVS